MTQRQRPTEQQALESVVVTRICNLGRWSREKSSKVLARKPVLVHRTNILGIAPEAARLSKRVKVHSKNENTAATFLQVDAEASSFRELLPTHDLLTTTP